MRQITVAQAATVRITCFIVLLHGTDDERIGYYCCAGPPAAAYEFTPIDRKSKERMKFWRSSAGWAVGNTAADRGLERPEVRVVLRVKRLPLDELRPGSILPVFG
jgi:hypothetical protein